MLFRETFQILCYDKYGDFMIDNIGIDIIENERIEKHISKEFINMVLTENEKSLYFSKIGHKKIEFLCGRFALKEAIIKAVNKHENPHFQEIEILTKKNGAPIATFKNYKFIVSIAHEKHYTVAQAILLR